MKVVHVIGNSNVGYFIGKQIEGDKVHQVEYNDLIIRAFKAGHTGATIYGLKNDESETGAGRKFREYIHYNNPIQNLVIVLGDVDARFHIRQDENISLKDSMGKVSKVLTEYLDNIDIRNIKRVVLFLPTPCSRDSLLYSTDGNSYSAIALKLMRVELMKLAQSRYEIGWRYISIYKETVGEDGFLADKFLNDADNLHCHYESVQPIVMEKLIEVLE